MSDLAPDLASLLTGENAAFIDQLYTKWCTNPESVSEDWRAVFSSVESNGAAAPRVIVADHRSIFHGRGEASNDPSQVAQRQARVSQLIRAYRVRGHTEARIDPLGRRQVELHPELTLEHYGLSESDLDVSVSSWPMYGVPELTTLRNIVNRLRRAYCGGFGVEFMNINDPSKQRWLQERLETLQDSEVLDREESHHVLRLLCDAENFERLIHNRFPGTKRFSIEGAESLIPLLDLLIEHLAEHGVDEMVLGMAHRGRLNVMANIMEKPIHQIIGEFEDSNPDRTFVGSGDVKYHLGYSSVYSTARRKRVMLSLAFNPSHLEAVNPVVEGRSRARQDRRGEGSHQRLAPLLIHGDAAFAGQGVVAETLNLSQLKGYATGGTIHVIVNNQIGFTTSPNEARSTPYCTDVARMLGVPIFHVNGEDVEAVASVARLAAEWRQTFHQDVIIDLYCFRKYGHNEGDEPSFTQPLLYDAIRAHENPRLVYSKHMVEERHLLTKEEAEAIAKDSLERLQGLLQPQEGGPEYDSYTGNNEFEMGKIWQPYLTGTLADPVDTRVDKQRLCELLAQVSTIPEQFNAHRKIVRLMKSRLEIAQGNQPVDWAMAELGAYATLVDQGTPVRLSGQDCGRGTFSHRHAVLTDIGTGQDYVPLADLGQKGAWFQIYNSMLSEAAVLGFDYGYTLAFPEALVIWEAQFGDFANGAQIIIDNFIMGSEQKWNRMTGIVMLLPHGYEGQGPEHSSARLERYLQLCAEDNMLVANCTTPANFFHLLRRQALQKLRKPLVVMSPKSMLRHPECVSTLDDLASGSFQHLIPETDEDVTAETVQRLVLCSGKIYYELRDARRERNENRVALVRIEQLYPLDLAQIQSVLDQYAQDVEVVWCQEEPRNMGAWPMMDEWLGGLLGGRPPRYVGRVPSASPATGSPKRHRAEQSSLIEEAISL